MPGSVIQGAFMGGTPRLTSARSLPGSPGTSQAAQPRRANAFALPPTALPLRPRNLGQPLPEAVLQRMQSLFATDFSAVRVHQGPEAAALGAQAFTHGTDLYFAPGQFSPGTPRGDQLIAHELAHVVQQKTGRVRNPFGSGIAVILDPGLEAEAVRMSLRLPPPSPRPQAPPPIQSFQRPGIHNQRLPAHPGGRTLQPSPNFKDYKAWLNKQNLTNEDRGVLNQRLVLAQRAIEHTRGKLLHGAGNIRAQVENSKSYSTKYAHEAYSYQSDMHRILNYLIEKDEIYLDDEELTYARYAPVAIAARKAKAGNCDHFAAVCLFYLIEHAPDDGINRIFHLGVGPGQGDHSAVVYADADWHPDVTDDTSAYRTAVVVDAWPTHAFAVAWAHWIYRTNNPKIDSTSRPQSGKFLRNYKFHFKQWDVYENLRGLKLQSLEDREKSQSFWTDPVKTTQFPLWKDAYPLSTDHPSTSFCFLTTACVGARGLVDDCEELSILRAFRDGYLVNRSGGEDLIAEYYRVAPRIVQGIQARPEAVEILDAVYGQVGRCVDLVLGGKFEAALQRYAGMVEDLREVFLD